MHTRGGVAVAWAFSRALGWTFVAVGTGRRDAPVPGRPAPRAAGPASRARATVPGSVPVVVPMALVHALRGRVVRWPARPARPLAVWIADPADGGADRARNRAAVVSAITAWDDAGLPWRLAPAPDSAGADVLVGWADQFPAPQTGRTDWTWPRGRAGHLTRARITLARRHGDGTPVVGAELRALALHELGHALGLGHARDAASVMAPFVAARALTPDAVRAARLLYRLPPGGPWAPASASGRTAPARSTASRPAP